jgi:hypothetical protein
LANYLSEFPLLRSGLVVCRACSIKISREDILAHAYAQCRSNKRAPGIDGQDFADIEAYGVERWLAELALVLRQETYRPEPIRRVFIPKANGKLRPLGISTVRDRVCMTATMLVLEPIFEADLPPEIYAYRAGALQFAQILGARVIATTSTAEKAERLRALGASDVINYSETPDWDAKARELTDGRGIDCVVEIGGPGTIAMSLGALAVGAHVSLIGEPVAVGDDARSLVANRPRH